MQIAIQCHGCMYVLCIGHKTLWFEQLNFITLTKEYINSETRETEYAVSLFSWF